MTSCSISKPQGVPHRRRTKIRGSAQSDPPRSTQVRLPLRCGGGVDGIEVKGVSAFCSFDAGSPSALVGNCHHLDPSRLVRHTGNA